jgi:uncharacterized membrane protein YedE/YeeE
MVTCDVHSVAALLLAVARQHDPAQGSFTASYEFWIGLFLGGLAAGIFGRGIGFLVAVIALFGAGILPAGTLTSSGHVPYLVVGVVALVAGLIFGRVRGLRHLGEFEFRARRTNIRRISRF